MVLPEIRLSQDRLRNIDNVLKLEWLVTNGLGGYASSTPLGVNTRKYHGLLVAALTPPTNRHVLVSKMDEEAAVGNHVFHFGANEFRDVIYPTDASFPQAFSIAPFPVFEYHAGNVRFRKTVFMPHEKNVTVIVYCVSNFNEQPAVFRVFPLLNGRHFYQTTNKKEVDWFFIQKPWHNGTSVQSSLPKFPSLTTILFSDSADYKPSEGVWIERVFLRTDSALGENCFDDCLQPGHFETEIAPQASAEFCVAAVAGKTGEEAQQTFSSLPKGFLLAKALLARELSRREHLIKDFQSKHARLPLQEWLEWLLLAADSFLVKRLSTGTETVIAGYHWFEDWGRDSLISLPGLTLVTGRYDYAKEILLTFKNHCRQGIVPNRFPDAASEEPAYNTVDATLWFFHAVLQYLKYTGDFDFAEHSLYEAMQSMIEHYVKGTLHNIRMDSDHLISHGAQLTWMDAVVNGKSVTPRSGKAVEIQALWYNALKTMQLLSTRFGQASEAENYAHMAEKTKASFLQKFWNPQQNCLYDVVTDTGFDDSMRPNQTIAVALDFSMLTPAQSCCVVDAVAENLACPYGLRTLAPDDPLYRGRYGGDWANRNLAYHNGSVWPWLQGFFVTAFLKARRYEERWRRYAFERFLYPLFSEQLFQAGLGTVSEIFDGDYPHTASGCISQAWSVAEPLRAYVEDASVMHPPYAQQVLKAFMEH